MMKWIKVAPGLSGETLGELLGLSARSVFRYIHDLRELGIPIKTVDGGYVLEYIDVMELIKLSGHSAEGKAG